MSAEIYQTLRCTVYPRSGLMRVDDRLLFFVFHDIHWSREVANWYLIKIQRWWRKHRPWPQSTIVAVCMGAHDRLGCDSPLSSLPDDLLRDIFRIRFGT